MNKPYLDLLQKVRESHRKYNTHDVLSYATYRMALMDGKAPEDNDICVFEINKNKILSRCKVVGNSEHRHLNIHSMVVEKSGKCEWTPKPGYNITPVSFLATMDMPVRDKDIVFLLNEGIFGYVVKINGVRAPFSYEVKYRSKYNDGFYERTFQEDEICIYLGTFKGNFVDNIQDNLLAIDDDFSLIKPLIMCDMLLLDEIERSITLGMPLTTDFAEIKDLMYVRIDTECGLYVTLSDFNGYDKKYSRSVCESFTALAKLGFMSMNPYLRSIFSPSYVGKGKMNDIALYTTDTLKDNAYQESIEWHEREYWD